MLRLLALLDVALTGAVRSALSLHKSLKPYAVAVKTEAAIVTLRGEVPSTRLATAAERVAAAVPDVRQVVNHLKVNQAVAAVSTDAGDQRSGRGSTTRPSSCSYGWRSRSTGT